MAGLLYTYTVTSIRAAKRNAQLHREADGGQVDMRRESLRRHGMLGKVEGTSDLELFRQAGAEAKNEKKNMGNTKALSIGEKITEEKNEPRSQVESGLEGYKGVGKAVEKFRYERPRSS